ncbi:MAG: inosose dehydratase [Gaiellaceae bacterium]|nr:inosose dehydratase [Gaiellaceae bacterium]
MSSSLRLASAPCTWGVWERTIGRDDLIPPERMLSAVQDLGYKGIELGPPGYFGTDPDDVIRLFAQYGVELVGAFAPLRIADEAGFREDLAFLDQTIAILAASGSHGPVVLAADENDVRLAVAGRPEARAVTSLQGDELRRAAERVQLAAQRAHDAGVAAAFHPHTATYFEGPEEVEALLDATDPALVKIAFDTGHSIVGGGDPVEFARRARDRIAHLHLKDVDGDILGRVRSGQVSVEEAWEEGMFCPFGEGVVDFAAVLAELPDFDGWAVVEQDRVAVRVEDLDAVRDVEARNLAVLAG